MHGLCYLWNRQRKVPYRLREGKQPDVERGIVHVSIVKGKKVPEMEPRFLPE